MKRLRSRRVLVINAIVFTTLMVLEMCSATVIMALTGGPSQPEVSSFTPISTSDMVNLSNGGFNYNIPLLDVGGYPINISYDSGISMDEEASWVGLGWNLNPGNVNRIMRSLPDDFNGQEVVKELNTRDNITVGITLGLGFGLFGMEGLGGNASLGIKYNNYNGIGFSQSLGASIDMGVPSTESSVGLGLSLTASDGGLDANASVSMSKKSKEKDNEQRMVGANVGLGFNSRAGLGQLTGSLSGGLVDVEYVAEMKDGKEVTSRKEKTRLSGSHGTSLSLTPNTYTPSIGAGRYNLAITFSAKLAPTFFGGDVPQGSVGAHYTHNKIKDKHRAVDSYGYLYAHESNSVSDQHDFNRENDAAFNVNVKNLPVTNQTFDLFNVAGQGVGGMYRAYRNDVGIVHDALNYSDGDDGSLGGEFGAGMLAKGGFDLKFNHSESYDTKWTSQNQAASRLEFETTNSNSELFEPSYFKQVGELTVDDEMVIENDGVITSFLEKIGGYSPVRIGLSSTGIAQSKFKIDHENGGTLNFPSSSSRFRQEARKKRNQLFSYLTVEEAYKYGVRPQNLPNFVSNEDVLETYKDQIGEITILQSSGARYVYGLPMYNTYQKETTFNVAGNNQSVINGTIEYDQGDNTLNNNKGIDHYYESTTLPPFAHSFMLTEILSSDYSDNDVIPGPSAGDYGNYTTFDYQTQSGYKWRAPYRDANFSEGYRGVQSDDKGSYIYGKKALSYLKKIKTKTHIAIFDFDDRKDAIEAAGENASGTEQGTQSMQKLNTIHLYALPEYEAALQAGETPEPIKVVHFEYDYALGSGVDLQNLENENVLGTVIPNNSGATATNEIFNQGGKLTLRKVYFTYGSSQKAKYSQYEFLYNSPNPEYCPKCYDMWGNYKVANMDHSNNYPSAPEYPYVKQEDANATSNASAWHISEIKLPSGGSIKVEFESDDYRYVQNKKAMQMFRVLGTADNNISLSEKNNVIAQTDDASVMNLSAVSNLLYDQAGPKRWTIIASDVSLSKSEWESAFQGLIGNSGTPIQFRIQTDVSNDGQSYEFVPGYARLDNSHYISSEENSSKYALVRFEGVEKENKDTGEGNNHPVSKAAWNYCRQNLPKKAYNLPDVENDSQLENIVDAIGSASILGQLVDLIQGPNGSLKAENKGRKIKQGLSWLRLNCPKNKKYGGGSRVKSIVSNDNWEDMTSGVYESSQYGQSYIYETLDGGSSGVAAYEPLMSKENPWVQPIHYNNPNRYTIPNFIERPLGVSFFPSPTITYSKVTVSDIVFDDSGDTNVTSNINTNGTGYAIHEFYTTKDFPTKVTWTDLKPIEKKSGAIGNLLKLDVKNFMTVSQGYSVEMNDMDGKPKSTKIFGQGQSDAISGASYVYGISEMDELTDVTNDPFLSEDITEYSLNNTVNVIDSNGDVSKSEVGIEVDFVSDFREQFNYDESNGIGTNLAGFLAGIFPIAIPLALPTHSESRSRFRSAVTTKVIHRRGILRETRAFDNGASVSTKNLAYDANTGQVLLTSTKNEFGDEIYNLNLPAYWSYDPLGHASKNIGYQTTITSDASGLISGTNDLAYGDEVALLGLSEKAWVWIPDNGTAKYLIDKFGNPSGSSSGYSGQVKVIKSGYSNQHESSMTSMTLMKNPLKEYDSNGTVLGDQDKIQITGDYDLIDASAIEYSDKWKTFSAETGTFDLVPQYTELGYQLKDWINSVINDPNDAWPQNSIDLSNSYYSGYNSLYMMGECEASIGECTSLVSENDYNTSNTQATFSFDCEGNGVSCEGFGRVVMEIHPNDTNMELSDLISIDLLDEMPPGTIQNSSTIAIYSATFTNGVGYIEIISKSFYGLYDFWSPPPSDNSCSPIVGQSVNPFVMNLRGEFRPVNSYAYLGERQYSNASSNDQSDIRKDGIYEEFDSYWSFGDLQNKWKVSADDSWTWTSAITEFNPYGPEVENINALYQNSSAVFGYNHTLPIAVAANTSYHQLAFDGFEDYNYYKNDGTCFERHFAFDTLDCKITEEEAHTGLRSILIGNSFSASSLRSLDDISTDDNCSVDPTPQFSAPYILRDCDVLGIFGPKTYDAGMAYKNGSASAVSQEYVFSYWVKEKLANGDDRLDFDTHESEILLGGSSVVFTSEKRTDVIDGWLRVEKEFTITSIDTGGFETKFTNPNSVESIDIYIDDVRIHPKDGSMKSYVYHPVNLRLVAELDDNNFATIYEYDSEGRLLRIKKETERGIMTIQESRTHTQKSN